MSGAGDRELKGAELMGENGSVSDQVRKSGSAATSSHFATDLGKGASYEQPTRFRVVALTDSMSILTPMRTMSALKSYLLSNS